MRHWIEFALTEFLVLMGNGICIMTVFLCFGMDLYTRHGIWHGRKRNKSHWVEVSIMMKDIGHADDAFCTVR